MMPTATTASSFSARHSVTRIGTNGMYSSAMPTVDAPSANSPTMPPTSHPGFDASRPMAAPIAASIAPVARTTPMIPPAMKTKKMMSCAAARPAGIDVRKASGGSGSASTARQVPGTTRRSSRSNSPAGSR